MYSVYGYGYGQVMPYNYHSIPYVYMPPPAANGSIADGMAQYYRVNINPNSLAGLPADTFHRNRTLVSSRYHQPVSEWKIFAKEVCSLASSVGTVAEVAGIFYPPALAVAAVAKPYTAALGVAGSFIDTTPKPVVVTTYNRYNPWFR